MILFNMRELKRNQIFTCAEDLKFNIKASRYIDDFPPISKEDNIEVIIDVIKQHYAETGFKITLDMLPDSAGGKWKSSFKKLKRKADGEMEKKGKKAKPTGEEAKEV